MLNSYYCIHFSMGSLRLDYHYLPKQISEITGFNVHKRLFSLIIIWAAYTRLQKQVHRE